MINYRDENILGNIYGVFSCFEPGYNIVSPDLKCGMENLLAVFAFEVQKNVNHMGKIGMLSNPLDKRDDIFFVKILKMYELFHSK